MKVYHLVNYDSNDWDSLGIFSSLDKVLNYKNKYSLDEYEIYEYELDKEGDSGNEVKLKAVMYTCLLKSRHKRDIWIDSPTFEGINKKIEILGKDLGSGISYYKNVYVNGVEYTGRIKESKWRIDENN